MKERGEEGNFREEVYSGRDKGRKRPVIREEIVNSEICTEKAMKVKKCREKRWRKKTSDKVKKNGLTWGICFLPKKKKETVI